MNLSTESGKIWRRQHVFDYRLPSRHLASSIRTQRPEQPRVGASQARVWSPTQQLLLQVSNRSLLERSGLRLLLRRLVALSQQHPCAGVAMRIASADFAF